jgi:ABC-2 type transport system ATP-binding protein
MVSVTKTFGAVRAVDDLSLVVPEGAVYGFIGPNGSGKTTAMRMIVTISCYGPSQIHFLGLPMCTKHPILRIGYWQHRAS